MWLIWHWMERNKTVTVNIVICYLDSRTNYLLLFYVYFFVYYCNQLFCLLFVINYNSYLFKKMNPKSFRCHVQNLALQEKLNSTILNILNRLHKFFEIYICLIKNCFQFTSSEQKVHVIRLKKFRIWGPDK